jgi:regulator of sigma D
MKKKMSVLKKRKNDIDYESNNESSKKQKTIRKIKNSRALTKTLRTYNIEHYKLFDVTNSIISKFLTTSFVNFVKYDHYALYVNLVLKKIDDVFTERVRLDDLIIFKVIKTISARLLHKN